MDNKNRALNPYLAGALTGLLLVLSVWIAGKFFGASTSYVRTAGLLEQTVVAEHVAQNAYFEKYFSKNAGIDWQWLFVFGIFLGAFFSSNIGRSFKWTGLPDTWQARFGAKPATRAITAFLGGAIALFGVRMAGGCPSGHGLSGLAQLSVSGYVAMIFFFIGGVITAKILYPGGAK